MKEQVPQFVIGWGTLALINAGLAQGKNRSGLGWFFLSLFLGPFATLLLVLLAKLPHEEPPSKREAFNLEDYRQQ